MAATTAMAVPAQARHGRQAGMERDLRIAIGVMNGKYTHFRRVFNLPPPQPAGPIPWKPYWTGVTGRGRKKSHRSGKK